MEGYKHLATYILGTVIYDLTNEFIHRWIPPKSRTCDQMDQAARSGKQNIAEGYTMSSLESYIKLLGVADGSFKELSADYEDFLRIRKLQIWDKNYPNLPNNPEEAANMLLTFCQMETFLLKRQIDALTEKFVKEGGFRENLFKKRMDYRKKL